MDAYNEAHLFVAAIRVLQHQKKIIPSLEDVCELLKISEESAHATIRELETKGIIEKMEDPYAIKLNVADHLAIENLPKTTEEKSSFADDLEKFQAKQKSAEKKVADIQAEIDKKKQDMLSDIEAKFKKEMDKFKNQ